MAEILLFHHAQGLTPGVVAFADELRAAGHTVHTPDLYDGNTYDTLDDGMGYARSVGFQTIQDRGVAAAEGLPDKLVYAGFSLGVMPAQRLAQNRPGAVAAVFFDAAMPPEEFGGPWPEGVQLQVHGMDADPWFAGEDLDAARALVAERRRRRAVPLPRRPAPVRRLQPGRARRGGDEGAHSAGAGVPG